MLYTTEIPIMPVHYNVALYMRGLYAGYCYTWKLDIYISLNT